MRKFINTVFVFVFLSSVAFGQNISVADVIELSKMNAPDFINYCKKKGYKYSGKEEIQNYLRTKIVGVKISMLQYGNGNYNYVRHTTRPSGQIKIKYEIYGKPTKRRSQKINSIKQQIKNLGFSINEREEYLSNCQNGKIYMRGKFERMCVNNINGVFAIDYVVKRSSGKITLE